MKKALLILFWVVQTLVLLCLPFVLLIRGSIWMYQGWHTPSWLGLIVGGLGAFVLVWFYLVFIYGVITTKLSPRGLLIKAGVVFLLLLSYCTFTLININAKNAKTDEVKQEFRSLHPYLRIGVGTLLFLDKGILVTDMSRNKEDYRKMGLPTKKQSLHYPQSDGYVHAMDLRTNGRSEFRNGLTKLYFRMMGFKTLRHVGTADHLHISLPTHEMPNAR